MRCLHMGQEEGNTYYWDRELSPHPRNGSILRERHPHPLPFQRETSQQWGLSLCGEKNPHTWLET